MRYRLDALTVVDIPGADAVQVLNNLTTADMNALAAGTGVETFVTEVRGRVVAHGCVYQLADRLRWIGAEGQAERLMAHVDRYIIREDARLEDRSEALVAAVVGGEDAAKLAAKWQAHAAAPPSLGCGGNAVPDGLSIFQVPWLGDADDSGALAWLVLGENEATLEGAFATLDLESGTPADFHRQRVRAGYPWFGVDLSEANLPQEADRDRQAISFTKGCYLGQETVARLDALGQVQKKLVQWRIDTDDPPASGTALVAGEKQVGTVTSAVPATDGGTIAIGVARRSHFDPGSEADCDGCAAVVAG